MTNTDKKIVTKYVVRRDTHRVSDALWDSRDDAKPEYDYWQNIVNRMNDGTHVTIQPIDTVKDS